MRVTSSLALLLVAGSLALTPTVFASGTRSSGAGGSSGIDSRGSVGGSDREGLLERGGEAVEEGTTDLIDGENPTSESCQAGQHWNRKAKKCVQKCEKGMRFSAKEDKCVKRKGKGKGRKK